MTPTVSSIPSMGRRERKKHEVRQRIIDVADRLIAEQGLAQTTVDQIAERADIAQATFFNYFSTKAKLVDALVERLVERWTQVVDEAHGADSSALVKIEALFEVSARFTEEQHRVLRDVIAETVRSPSLGPRRSLGRMRDVFATDLAAAQERGEVRADRSADSLADAVLGLYMSVMLFWSADAGYPVADRLRSSATLVAELISSRSATEDTTSS
jgi:AcrR family transcriptional regulator